MVIVVVVVVLLSSRLYLDVVFVDRETIFLMLPIREASSRQLHTKAVVVVIFQTDDDDDDDADAVVRI